MMKKILTLLLITTLSMFSSACLKRGLTKKNNYEATKPQVVEIEKINNGSIYHPGMRIGLLEDHTARYVGDVLMIKLKERATANAISLTKTEKSQNVALPPPKVAGGPVTHENKEVLNNEVEAGRDFQGGGSSNQEHTFEGVISVTVAEVLPNRNLLVKGEKLITLNQVDEFIRFSGIVRPHDIAPDNSVESVKVADVHIGYAGQGTLSSANKMGPLARFFQSPVFPY